MRPIWRLSCLLRRIKQLLFNVSSPWKPETDFFESKYTGKGRRKLVLCQRFRITHFVKYRTLQSQKAQRKSRTVCSRFSRCSCVSVCSLVAVLSRTVCNPCSLVCWQYYLERSLLSHVNSVAHQLSDKKSKKIICSSSFVFVLWHFGGHLVCIY